MSIDQLLSDLDGWTQQGDFWVARTAVSVTGWAGLIAAPAAWYRRRHQSARISLAKSWTKFNGLRPYNSRILQTIGHMQEWALMSLWGKLAGATAGLAVGGPVGALIGGLAGHFVIDQESPQAANERKQMAFTAAVIALGAKMAKADGVVTRAEVHAFKEVFKVSERDMHNVARLFDLAKRDVHGYESYAKQINRLFHDDRELLRHVLDGLFHIAKADSVFHRAEEQYLATVAHIFGFSDSEFRCIKAHHLHSEERCPYELLGVSSEISDGDLKAQYRKLVIENHPDRLIAQGLPPEFIQIATKKVAAINSAYEDIRRERGI
jgi:DnaJ like chaperone protein